MAFSDQEKVRIRHHMGYLGVAQVQTFSLGVPSAVETQFLIEGAMNRVLPASEIEARRIVGVLDTIEAQMVGDLELLAVEKIGDITVDGKEQGKLKQQYRHWQAALGNMLGVPPNPYDQRFLGGGGGVNARVAH